ncbi:hypothetical protein [Paenibacillus chitinolyticus]|uniref:hypothetical protein n=1 Tax=Paenibacillus chitinolyticus TaxID=79263 RepID=UPI003CFEB4DD
MYLTKYDLLNEIRIISLNPVTQSASSAPGQAAVRHDVGHPHIGWLPGNPLAAQDG